MQILRMSAIGFGGGLCLTLALALATTTPAAARTGGSGLHSIDRAAHALEFASERPGTALWRTGAHRITRVYGRAFSEGRTARESAERFRLDHAALFGVSPEELVPASMARGGAHEQPVMFDAARNDYKFMAYFYTQVRQGIPVFRGQLKLLVRNEPGFPLVLASADVRDVGNLQVDPGLDEAADLARLQGTANAAFGPLAQVLSVRAVVWAGVDDQLAVPRPAYESIVGIGPDKWLTLVDAERGTELYREHLICRTDIEGAVSGLATIGIGAEQCEPEQPRPLPWLEVNAGGDSAFTDADGQFVIPHGGDSPIAVTAGLTGMWFDVFDFFDNEAFESDTVTPPGPAALEFNSANDDENVRAQVNGYLYSNVIRDFVLEFNPDYPTLGQGGFPVRVNRTDFVCPGNAWYDPDEVSINFCLSSGNSPNTAWTSVVYHEYGHHLVAAAGSGQGAYGEGTGDTMSVLLLDSPLVGFGFFGDCGSALRNAENDLQYPCSGGSHFCGQLIAGCVWETRNELAITDPFNFINTISNLAINAILLHTGSGIDPSITIDYLTLDDDNGNIFDGTPHYDEIDTGFSEHGMDAPDLAILDFQFPDGLPDLISPFGDQTIRVEVSGVTGTPQPGTGVLHLSTAGAAGGFVEIPMTEISPNVYDAEFPELDCASGVSYYFSAESTGGQTATWPVDAPEITLSGVAATEVVVSFEDDFENDLGWTVQNAAGDGAWDRGVPAGGGDRGDPPTDADGSGQCYLTDNEDGNSDVDDGSTTLTSPPLDATAEGAFISYWRWFSNDQGDGPFSDAFEVEVSSDGSSWVALETVGPAGPEVSGGWFFRQFPIADVVEPTSSFRIRFVASDFDPQSIVEAGIDGVGIRSFVCKDPGDCPGDTDGNGEVDVDDLVNLILAWGSADPDADLDGSGNVDVDDLVLMILAWGPC